MNNYVIKKILFLKQFGISLTYEQKEHMKTLKSPIAVDNFCHDILKNM